MSPARPRTRERERKRDVRTHTHTHILAAVHQSCLLSDYHLGYLSTPRRKRDRGRVSNSNNISRARARVPKCAAQRSIIIDARENDFYWQRGIASGMYGSSACGSNKEKRITLFFILVGGSQVYTRQTACVCSSAQEAL